MPTILDLNNPQFQADLFALEKAELVAAIKTLYKLSQLEWSQIYQDKGLKWELVQSKTSRDGDKLYTIRFTQKCRAVVRRKGDAVVFLSIHPDHDSAY